MESIHRIFRMIGDLWIIHSEFLAIPASQIIIKVKIRSAQDLFP